MQTALAFSPRRAWASPPPYLRLAEPRRRRAESRARGPRVAVAKSARLGRSRVETARGWLKPVVRALIVVGEWLALIADVVVHVYLA